MIRVWDIAVRAGHWLLVVLVTVSVVTGTAGGNAMTWHERSGTLILAIVLFRWAWGVLGSTTARFGDFLVGPRRVLAFAGHLARGRPALVYGHNPLGGWMVVALLLSLTLQAASGLFADDEILTSGPLAHLVTGATSARLTAFHQSHAWVLVGLVAVHVAAILFHRVARGENLVLPMLTGYRAWPDDAERPRLRFASAWLAPLLFFVIATGVYGTVAYLGH